MMGLFDGRRGISLAKGQRSNIMAITVESNLAQVVREHPETVPVFLRHGLMCIGCAAARFESIGQGANAHGLDAEALVLALNEALEAQPEAA
jgi:hybrid cluster-associated redox disulfide protein